MSRNAKLSAIFFQTIAILVPAVAQTQKNPDTARILSARFVYFEDRTGADVVGRHALAELKKWRKFEVVTDRCKANLIFVPSADSPRGGNLIVSGGQTGTIEHGDLHTDPYPNYTKSSPVRWASLEVLMPTPRKGCGVTCTNGADYQRASIVWAHG